MHEGLSVARPAPIETLATSDQVMTHVRCKQTSAFDSAQIIPHPDP